MVGKGHKQSRKFRESMTHFLRTKSDQNIKTYFLLAISYLANQTGDEKRENINLKGFGLDINAIRFLRLNVETGREHF